ASVEANCGVCHLTTKGLLTDSSPVFPTGFGGAHSALALPTVPSFDAVYLPGHGAVFTLKVPHTAGVALDPVNKTAAGIETCLTGHKSVGPARAPSAAKPSSEWDRTQAELRGAKPAAEPKPAAGAEPVCDPGRLTDRVVEKLWQNAKNVRHLPAGENFTVVIT